MWRVIQRDWPGVASFVERPHDRVHIGISIVEEGLGETGQWRADVAEMDHEDSALRLEVMDGLLEIAEVLSALGYRRWHYRGRYWDWWHPTKSLPRRAVGE